MTERQVALAANGYDLLRSFFDDGIIGEQNACTDRPDPNVWSGYAYVRFVKWKIYHKDLAVTGNGDRGEQVGNG